MVSSSRWGSFFDVVDSGLRVKLTELWMKNSKPPPVPRRLLLVVSLHQSDPLSDTFFCDIVVNHEIIKRACLSQQRALEEMLHRLISFFTITRGVILNCIFLLS